MVSSVAAEVEERVKLEAAEWATKPVKSHKPVSCGVVVIVGAAVGVVRGISSVGVGVMAWLVPSAVSSSVKSSLTVLLVPSVAAEVEELSSVACNQTWYPVAASEQQLRRRHWSGSLQGSAAR
jgi:hypothetical protein